jgi:glycosyltransferase involved in cell wall biosynthesis
MPSLWEGMPIALFEEMVAEKAIVTAATGGNPRGRAHGEQGLLVPPGDVGHAE